MIAFILGSGSSGNCLVLDCDGDRLVLDAGLNPTLSTKRMRALGGDLLGGRATHGVFVTHHHADHIGHAGPIGRSLRAPVFLHDGIVAAPLSKEVRRERYSSESPTVLGPFTIDAFPLPHDAPQMALRVRCGGETFGLVTDLGHVPEGLLPFLASCDAVLLESNHCPVMMETCSYPQQLRDRIVGPEGHLSNEQAAELVEGLRKTAVRFILFGHLSRVANTKRQAERVLTDACGALRFAVLERDTPARLDVARASFQIADGLALSAPSD